MTSNQSVNTLGEQAGAYWYRVPAFRWDLIEPNQTPTPSYDWSQVDEKGLADVSARGMQIIATIRFSPGWARTDQHLCAAIKPEALPRFAQFLGAIVRRYSAPPYNIRLWELGNEPDVAPEQVSGTLGSVFGCWGNKADPYFGGEYYAEMLKMAYPAIKAADPGAKVMIGGLLLDCDPTDTTSCPSQVNGLGIDGKIPPKFFEGILRAGGGDYFDLVSFHGYPVYTANTQGNPVRAETGFSTWRSRGGVVMGKVSYLKQLMAQYGVSKPIFHTEGGLLCPEWDTLCTTPPADFEGDQAAYLVWLFARNWAEGITGTIWYTLDGPGWRSSGLLDSSQQPRLPYQAMVEFNRRLGRAVYKGKITSYSPLAGYEFTHGSKIIDVIASPDDQSHSITVPENMTAYDVLGNALTPTNGVVLVSTVIYLETNS